MTVHRTRPPTRAMRETPDIDQLKRQARELLEAYRAQSPEAVTEVDAHHRTATPETFALHDAQFVLARSYGFESWPKLKAAVEGVTTKRLHEAVQKGDLGAVRALLARRPEIVDLLREGPSGFEIRAIHIAVMARDVEMTHLLLDAGADTRHGIWPNRDATSPRTIAEERGYDEIVALMTAQEEKRGARSVNALDDGVRRLSDAMMTGGEEAVIAVFESEPGLAGMCPPDGVTMLHRAAQYGLLRVATWLSVAALRCCAPSPTSQRRSVSGSSCCRHMRSSARSSNRDFQSGLTRDCARPGTRRPRRRFSSSPALISFFRTSEVGLRSSNQVAHRRRPNCAPSWTFENTLLRELTRAHPSARQSLCLADDLRRPFFCPSARSQEHTKFSSSTRTCGPWRRPPVMLRYVTLSRRFVRRSISVRYSLALTNSRFDGTARTGDCFRQN